MHIIVDILKPIKIKLLYSNLFSIRNLITCKYIINGRQTWEETETEGGEQRDEI